MTVAYTTAWGTTLGGRPNSTASGRPSSIRRLGRVTHSPVTYEKITGVA